MATKHYRIFSGRGTEVITPDFMDAQRQFERLVRERWGIVSWTVETFGDREDEIIEWHIVDSATGRGVAEAA